MSYPCIPDWYEFSFHSLGVHGLTYFKTYKITEGRPIHVVLPIFQSFDETIQSELALSKKSIQEKCKKEMDDILDDERRAFEIQKHALETELAKYKGIVENCMKEISSYEF
jgi:3-methyladenine DNA glycosylase/8-oxoguanine DNA glycosylase